jgi:hypothetical protein
MALLKDTTAFYGCVLIIVIASVIFRAKPWIPSGVAPGRATEGARWTAAHIAAIVNCCTTDVVIAVQEVVWVIALPFIRPGMSSVTKGEKNGASKDEYE